MWDAMALLFFNFWPFTLMKICPKRHTCKGCKGEGRRKGEYLGYLHDTGLNPVSVEQTLRVSSDLK